MDEAESKMVGDHLCIASEIVEVEALLESIPEGNLIERKSLEARLEYLKVALATMGESCHSLKGERNGSLGCGKSRNCRYGT
jgi:hypothetical protein